MDVACEVAAVVVTLRDTPRLRAALDSVRASTGGHDLQVVCVVNDPAAVGTWTDDGVRFVGAGINLGWAGGMHLGLLGIDSDAVWAVQDDLTVAPDALSRLRAALAADPTLGAVRPLPVDDAGRVRRFSLGGVVPPDGRAIVPLPARDVPAATLEPVPVGSYLPSSGQLIRRAAWDAVGGFDPWFFPWGFVDTDFGRSLTTTGWRFATVPAARMRHEGGASSSTLFRQACHDRNRELFAAKWADTPGPGRLVSAAIVDAARAGRATQRAMTAERLRDIAGVAGTDLALALGRWLTDNGYRAHRPSWREAVRRRLPRSAP